MTISVTNIKLFLLAFGPYSGIDDTYPLAQICFEMTNSKDMYASSVWVSGSRCNGPIGYVLLVR